MIRIINENVDISVSLEKAKRQILAIRHELEQNGSVSNQLGVSFSVVDDTLTTIIEEIKNLFD